MLYFGLHWSEQLRVAPVVELSEELPEFDTGDRDFAPFLVT